MQNGCRHERYEKSAVGRLTAQTSQNVNLEVCVDADVDDDAASDAEGLEPLRFLIASSTDQLFCCSKILDSGEGICKKMTLDA